MQAERAKIWMDHLNEFMPRGGCSPAEYQCRLSWYIAWLEFEVARTSDDDELARRLGMKLD